MTRGLILLLGLLAAAPAAATPWAERYRQCTDVALADPKRGLALAESWRAEAGGVAAKHCQGMAMLGLGRTKEAGNLLREAADELWQGRNLGDGPLKRSPELVGRLYAQAAAVWLELEQPGQAYALYSRAVEAYPANADLWVDRSRALAVMNDFVRADADLTRAIQLAPDRGDLYLLRGTVRRYGSKLAEAAQDVETANAMLPNDAAVLLERGSIGYLQGDAQKAEANWRDAAARGGDTAAGRAARMNLENLLATVETRIEPTNVYLETAKPRAPAPAAARGARRTGGSSAPK
jgi:tetratricopeptide (TPR) repeat protein